MIKKFFLIVLLQIPSLLGMVQCAVIRNLLDRQNNHSSKRLPAQERTAHARRLLNEQRRYYQKQLPITAYTDLILTTVTPIDRPSPALAQALREAVLELKQYDEFDFERHFKVLESNLARMEQAGLFKKPQSKNMLFHGFKHFLTSLKPNDPRDNPREFALNVIKYIGIVAFHGFTNGALVEAQVAASLLFKAHQLISLDTGNMTQEQIVDVVAEELATVAWDVALAKAAPVVQDKAVKLGSNLLRKVKSVTLEQAVLKTVEGAEFKVSYPEPAQNKNVFQNTAEKKISSNSVSSILIANEIPKVANMKQVFELNDFGKALKKGSIKTKFVDIKTNSQVYEIIEKMPEFGLNKGDRLYLDKFHGDHIEVFRNDVCVDVLNLDGTRYKNAAKALGRDLLVK